MARFSLAAALALLATAPAVAQKEFGFDNRKGSGQPYLKPDETVAKFKVPDEFEVKLFAGEPQVVNPVAFTIDEKGRVWVVECFEYPKKTPKGKAPRDRIVILEDTDGDGTCDKRTVFAEGKDFPVPEERAKAGLGAFDLCTGIEVGHGGVFVGAAPYLFFIENKNDKPGKFEVLLKGFGSQDTHETLNTFQWGPDGWLYGLHGVFTQSNVRANPAREGGGGQFDGPETRMNAAVWRYHPKQRKFEIFAEGTSNPWGMDWRNTDGQFVLACCVIPHLFHIVPGGIYKRQAGSSYNPHAYGYINEICDHTFHKESGWAHAGLLSLDVPHMPKRFQNSVIFGSIHGCSLKQNVLKPNGSTYTASRGDDFLQSGDKNFRPINLRWGPNGDIYLIDWHDQNPCHQTAPDLWDYERGRVYRIQLKGTKTKAAPDLSTRTFKELARALVASANPWEYRTAFRLLHERYQAFKKAKKGLYVDGHDGQSIGEEALRSADPVTQLRGYWLLTVSNIIRDQYGSHKNSAIRAWHARLFDGDFDHAYASFMSQFGAEKDPRVRAELAASLLRRRSWGSDAWWDTTLNSLAAVKEDASDPVIPHLLWLATEKLITNDHEHETMYLLAEFREQAPDSPIVANYLIPRAMRRLGATGKPDNLRLCIEFIAKVKDANTREKALDGLALGLDKQFVAPPAGWAELQSDIAKENNPKLVALTNKLSVSFRDPAAIKRALDAAMNAKLPVEARAEAVQQLAALKPQEGLHLLTNLVGKSSGAPDALRAEAIRALAAYDNAVVPNTLLGGWADLPKALRPDAVNTLATRKEWARALLNATAAKKVDRAELTDNVITRIQAFNDKELNALIESAWGRTRATPAELGKLIDQTRDSLYAAPASFARGRKVFEANCGKCHKFEGKGAEVGPPLDGAGRDIEYLLANVLDPNRVIGAPYFLRTARLKDDTVFSGLLAEEDDKFITLKLENAVLKKIPKDDLDGPVRVAEKSLMPEGLGYNMTAQDFRDLVRFAMANPFLTDVTVNGAALSAGVPGRLVLPDTKGGPAVVEARFTSQGELRTRLLVGASGDYEVRLNGKAIGTGVGAGKDVRPDRDGFDVVLPAGGGVLTLVVKGGGGAVYARFLDPDRKLTYPEPAGQK